jgi:NAD(P)-dependent dehydrogenase (short-subunit alcohol dehydrogenase family)
MRDLRDKVAVVTGGASGIGFAMAERFAREGAKLVLADIEATPLEEAAQKLAAATEVLVVQTDVADAAQMDALAAKSLDRFGAIHIVCNNAGVAGGGVMWELSTEDWEFVLRVNLWGVIHGIRVFARHLVEQNEGHIVNTASMAGLISVPGMGPYNVSKHAVVTLSETLYGELQAAGSEVGVSVLCPGFVNTRIFESDRNRPDVLRNPGGELGAEEREERRKVATQFFASAMSPNAVAEKVLAAVTEKRFYILTHGGAEESVRRRMDRIIEGENPKPPEPTVFAERR